MAKTKDDASVVDDGMTAVIEDLSDEELMDLWTQFGHEVAAMRERLKEFSQEHQKRVRKEQLKRVAGYSETDIALLQEIAAEGRESDTQMGEPGKADDNG